MLGNVFLHLLPEMQEDGMTPLTLILILGGILLSFLIEKVIRWHHCHDPHCHDPSCLPDVRPAGVMTLIGDASHNFIDGILIMSAFLASVPLGIAATTAVILHEIPQEIGDFAVLVHSGFTRKKALLWNFFSACTAFLGGFTVLALASTLPDITTILLPITAGNFLYIAIADLIPELHKQTAPRSAVFQLLGILAGIGLMGLLAMMK